MSFLPQISGEKNGNKLQGNLHRLVYEVLTESIKDTKEGYCTEIEVIIADDGTIKIIDNGKGIPFNPK